MAKNNYTHLLMQSLNNHQDVLCALQHLVDVTPNEDSHYQMIYLLNESLSDSFSKLQSVSIKAVTSYEGGSDG